MQRLNLTRATELRARAFIYQVNTISAFPALSRREALSLLAGAGASTLLKPAAYAANKCIALAQAQTEGPYWVEEYLNRSDVRLDPSDGSVRPGALLNLTLNIQEVSGGACGPLAGAHVDIWHCDAAGLYSDVAANSTVGKKFLRGYPIAGDDGAVQFTTVYPGWYSGRTVHIHIRIRTYTGAQVYDAFAAQIFFDDTLTDQVSTSAPYNSRRARDTRNSNDLVLTQTRGATFFANVTKGTSGYSGTATVGVNLKTPATAAPSIQTNAVVNAASFAPGIAPGSWHAVFGQNLSASTHSLSSDDLVNGALPTRLSGVSLTVNNKAAFLSCVSPTQGAASASAGMAIYQPAFFASGKYALAVSSDGAVTAGGTGVRPGQIVQFYGTGIGPTSPPVAAGSVPAAPAPLGSAIGFTIGGNAAEVSFAGISGAGLYQFNVAVPSLPPGDYGILARIDGSSTQADLLLRISG